MKSIGLFVLLIVVVGVGAFLGSVAGAALDREGNVDLFAGAWIGGLAAIWGAVALAVRLGWISRDRRLGVALGVGVGFVVTAFVAMNRSSSLPGVLASIALIGVGGILGARLGRRESPGP